MKAYWIVGNEFISSYPELNSSNRDKSGSGFEEPYFDVAGDFSSALCQEYRGRKGGYVCLFQCLMEPVDVNLHTQQA